MRVTPVRYAPDTRDDPLDVSRLMAPQTEGARVQPSNINRRLVPYGPDLPLAERRARDLAQAAADWYAFAETHLQDGDVLFRLGAHRTHLVMNFSRVTAKATRSRYSHSGVMRWRDGVPEVVDITSTGFRAQAFPVWMREVDRNTYAIARLKPEYRDRIPAVLAFLETQSRERPTFDFTFEPDNGRFYCNEMTEEAFRSAGVPLSEAVPKRALPGFRDVPIASWLIKVVGGVDMEIPVYVVGNADYGMYASDKLDVVYVSPDAPAATSAPAAIAALPNLQ